MRLLPIGKQYLETKQSVLQVISNILANIYMPVASSGQLTSSETPQLS